MTTGEHLPFVAGRLQASQAAEQLLSQQTPSAHVPDLQSCGTEQLSPFSLGDIAESTEVAPSGSVGDLPESIEASPFGSELRGVP